MKIIFALFFLIAFSFSAKAQYYEEILMDSLQRTVDNPETTDADRIYPLTSLSRLYIFQGDSVKATEALSRARRLALREKDSKYMIYVYERELSNSLNQNPKKITLAYQIIDSIYMAIKKTSDTEAQAVGYSVIGMMKNDINPEYDLDDTFKSLSLAEKLPEKSTKKYEVMSFAYYIMFVRYSYIDRAKSEQYLDLMQQTAEKWGDKSNMCMVMSYRLNFNIIYSENDKNLLTQEFETLENFISENINNLHTFEYGQAIGALIAVCSYIPNAQYLKKLENHIETYKKIAGKNFASKTRILFIKMRYALIQKNYAEAINFIHQRIELNKLAMPQNLFNDYRNLAFIYSEAGQYKQAYEAMDTCLNYQQQYESAKLDEQHQLAEEKLGVAKQQQEIQQQRNQIFIISITAILLLVVFILTVWSLNRQKKIDKLEKEKERLIAKQAMSEKEIIGARLMTHAAELARKDQLLDKAKDLDSKQFGKMISRELKTAKVTKDYAKLFQEIRPEFYEWLAKQAAPDKLSKTELKYCTYISMRMSNKDLANVMNVGSNTVSWQKHRLKKKLHLNAKDSLEEFIVTFAPTANII